MKKKIAIFLALGIILSLCACGTVQKAEPTPSPTPVPTPTPAATPIATPSPTPVPKLTRNEAYDFLKEYLKTHEDVLISRLVNKGGGKYEKISVLNIATISDGCSYKIYVGDNDYGFKIKGNFWGDDEYGKTVGKFVFEWDVVVRYPRSPTSDYRADVELTNQITVKKS